MNSTGTKDPLVIANGEQEESFLINYHLASD